MDPRIDALVAEQRLEDAAELASELGDWDLASDLWERACDFRRAARAALGATNPAQALVLAARAGDQSLEDECIAALSATTCDRTVADPLRAMGRHATAARLLLALGHFADAARDLEAAGQLFDAAAAHEAAGAPREAARCLEALIRQDDTDHRARLELGTLLLRHDRWEPALRILQPIPEAAPERDAALPLLHRALTQLDLLDAARDVQAAITAREHASPPLPRPRPRSSASAGLGLVGLSPGGSREAPNSQQVMFGRYLIEREVARTLTARVLKARDRISGDWVAVKVFSSQSIRDVGRDALRRFEQEARVLGELQHRAIVPLRAYHPEGPALVLEWMSGGSLADLLERESLAPARAAEIAVAVFDALEEAHRRGFLHRDVKPANVLFDGAGAPHLADFGTAHVSDAAATVTAGVLGTLAYMAPEQRAGAQATLASDVYGAGALLWHALTGAPPGGPQSFLSDELGDHHRDIVEQLIAPAHQRPADAHTARALVRSVDWPPEVPTRRGTTQPHAEGASAASVRLEPLGGARYHDTLLERAVRVLPPDPDTMAKATEFARVSHPNLAAVLCHRAAPKTRGTKTLGTKTLGTKTLGTKTLWIEDPVDTPDSLDAATLRAIREALDTLHSTGAFHGSVDPEHIAVQGDRAVLRFPLAVRPGSREEDLVALDALVARADSLHTGPR